MAHLGSRNKGRKKRVSKAMLDNLARMRKIRLANLKRTRKSTALT
jgi:hypothetical protein